MSRLVDADLTDQLAAVTSESVAEVISQVWESLFDAPAIPGPHVDGSDLVAAAVDIDGAWDGTVVLTCSRPVATAMTGRMLDLAPDRCDDDDVADAMGEVVNMVGGNVKSLIDGCALGLPRSGEIVTGTPVVTHHLDWHGECVTFTVLDRPPAVLTSEDPS